ncbi:MAG: hypothetical protein KJZ65_13010 [Phycisphaerales bacterium]|nr:hypothetical protein [Phycisphaerales bacterium]
MSQHGKRIQAPRTDSAKPGATPSRVPVRGRSLDAFRNDLVNLFARARRQTTRPGT